MLMRPDLLQGGPAYVDMMPGAMPEQVSMLPFAPETPAPSMPQPMTPQPSMPSGLGARQNFIDERDMYMGAAPDRFSRMEAEANALANAPQRDPVTGLLLNAQGQQGFQFMTDRGRQAGFGKGNTGFLTADPNAQYRMFDERGKNRIVAEGTGVDALRNIYNTANQFNKEQGKKANWGIERLNPTTGRWERVAENDPAKGLGVIGDIASVALPIGAAILTGGASIPIKMAAGAAAGGLGAAAAGRDPLKAGIISGLTAGAGAAGGKLGKAGTLGKSIGAKTGTVIGSGVGATAGGLATGQSLEQSLKGGALAAAGTFASQKLAPVLGGLGIEIPGYNVPKNFTPGGPIVVTPTGGVPIPVSTGMGGGGGQPKPPPQIDADGNMVLTGNRFNVVTGAAPMFGAGIPAMIPQGVPTTPEELARKQAEDQENEIIVPGERLSTVGGAFPSLKAVPGAPNTIPQSILDAVAAENAPRENEIVVTNTPQPTIPVTPLTPADVASDFDKEFGKKSLGEQLKDRVKNLDAADYLRLAGVLLPLLDGGGGGGRRGALSTIPGGMFGRSSVFGGSLPRATMPGASTGFAPRTPSALGPQTTQDYYRYGYGPAQSFFDYVPQGQPNTSRAFTGYEQAQAREDQGFYLGGMAGGGDMAVRPRNSFAVNGPGSGRSDDIPAMLSDGEYVMDAETVALLGDGSPQEGADRLDKFRKNVRQHKARKLAKGEFSDNAKSPEYYLKGGRT
jgi:hypothetical protein